MTRSEFIYNVTSSFLNGKTGVVWAKQDHPFPFVYGVTPERVDPTYEWCYWALRNLCALSDFKMSDFTIKDNSIILTK